MLGLHVLHWYVPVHVTGFDPVQVPLWHVSVCVHAFPSLHEVPLVTLVCEQAYPMGRPYHVQLSALQGLPSSHHTDTTHTPEELQVPVPVHNPCDPVHGEPSRHRAEADWPTGSPGSSAAFPHPEALSPEQVPSIIARIQGRATRCLARVVSMGGGKQVSSDTRNRHFRHHS